MTEPYTFDFEGTLITYQRATVRTELESQRIRQKLIEALGYENAIPTDEFNNADTYADCMARSKTSAAWWCHSNMTKEEIKAAYDAFMDADNELYLAFNRAYVATLPPKKTIPLIPET